MVRSRRIERRLYRWKFNLKLNAQSTKKFYQKKTDGGNYFFIGFSRKLKRKKIQKKHYSLKISHVKRKKN